VALDRPDADRDALVDAANAACGAAVGTLRVRAA